MRSIRTSLALILFLTLATITFAQRSRDRGSSADRLKRWLDGMFKGKPTLRLSEVDSRTRGFLSRILERAGIKGDLINRSQLEAGLQKMQKEREKARQSSGGSSRSRNRNEKLSEEELEKRLAYYFKRHDKNGDGVLNYEEMSSKLKGEYAKWDRNKNRLISLIEYRGYLRNYYERQRKEREAYEKAKTEGRFAGALPPGYSIDSEEDLIKDLDKKPIVFRSGDLGGDMTMKLEKIDTDKDAQIRLYEWKTAGLELKDFEFYDRNGDAFLTVAEVISQSKIAKEEGRGDPKGLEKKSSYSPSSRSRWSWRRR